MVAFESLYVPENGDLSPALAAFGAAEVGRHETLGRAQFENAQIRDLIHLALIGTAGVLAPDP